MWDFDFEKQFEYENGFYLTAPVNRMSKLVTHLDLFRRVTGLTGDVVECGVFKGVSFARWVKFRSLLENAHSRRIIGFDTFGKFPEATYEEDQKKRDQFISQAGDMSISAERLKEALEHVNLNQNIELIEGDINETVHTYVKENPDLKISLLHIDVDLLDPTRTCLECFWPHVVRGGIIILDDYGAFAGANKAIDEFFANTELKIQKLPFSNAISFVEKL